jgi:hypothetical protein
VNCLDCLDRTNLVMSELAQRVLTRQMEAFGVGSAWASSRQIVERLFKEVQRHIFTTATATTLRCGG